MSDGLSKLAQGNAFRDSAKRLIELTPGCYNVQAECQIGTQSVDIYYEERTSFRNLRVACECKDYGRPLTRDLIGQHIYPRYHPLLQNNLVDAVRIIAPLDIGPIAGAYVRECGFSFHTVDQLESEIIDFRQYLHSLRIAFADDGLDRYYVKPVLDDGNDLESCIETWITGTSSQPVAILAGYGMGKTSFARRLAHVLAGRALEDPRNRIPILIPLSEISSEQTLEGLLGKLLAAKHRVPGYHFSPFNELNLRGRFVMILDGFDEMKHTMSWAEFRHNFGELNRLNGPGARVLLLGRPSALLSEDEELFVLRGRRRTRSQIYTVPGAPEYVQLAIREFSSLQAIEFIRRYAAFRGEIHSAFRPGYQKVDIELRIQSIQEDPEMMSLAARPVQARMLADLAIDPEVKWRSFSRYELYREFIGRITEREAGKPARSVFHQEARLSFIRKVAWWVWGRASSSGFNLAELPDTLLGPIPSEVEATSEGVRRDLVAGSILEKKVGDCYYFPHRSFLEFLVVEYMCIEGGVPLELEYFSYGMTREIADFIRDSDHASDVARWAQDLDDVESSLSVELLMVIAWACNRVGTPRNARADVRVTPRALMIEYFRFVDRNTPTRDVANYFVDALVSVADPQSRITCIVALLLVQSAAERELQLTVRRRIVAFILSACLKQLRRLSDPTVEIRQDVAKSNPFMWMLAGAFMSRRQGSAGDFSISMDLNNLYEQASDTLQPKFQLGGMPASRDEGAEEIRLVDLEEFNKRLTSSSEAASVMRFFTRFPEPSVLLPATYGSDRHKIVRRKPFESLD